MQRLYAEVKFNPLAGLSAMLLQMPIFIALFQVLSEMGSRTSGTTTSSTTLVPSLDLWGLLGALAVGFGTFVPLFDPYGDLRGNHVFAHGSHADGNKDNPQRKQTMIMAAVMERVHALDQLELARRRASVLGRVLPHGHCAATDLHAHHGRSAAQRGRWGEPSRWSLSGWTMTRKQKKPRPTKERIRRSASNPRLFHVRTLRSLSWLKNWLMRSLLMRNPLN